MAKRQNKQRPPSESPSSPSSSSSSSASSATKVYQVEVITKARVTTEGFWEYYVKWYGYESDDNSWEPAENMANCERLLKGFWLDVGMDNDDHKPGTVFEASKGWIDSEILRNAKLMSKNTSNQKRTNTRGRHTGFTVNSDKGKTIKKESSTRLVKNAIHRINGPSVSSESSENDAPLANNLRASTSNITGKRQRRSPDASSSSEIEKSLLPNEKPKRSSGHPVRKKLKSNLRINTSLKEKQQSPPPSSSSSSRNSLFDSSRSTSPAPGSASKPAASLHSNIPTRKTSSGHVRETKLIDTPFTEESTLASKQAVVRATNFTKANRPPLKFNRRPSIPNVSKTQSTNDQQSPTTPSFSVQSCPNTPATAGPGSASLKTPTSTTPGPKPLSSQFNTSFDKPSPRTNTASGNFATNYESHHEDVDMLLQEVVDENKDTRSMEVDVLANAQPFVRSTKDILSSSIRIPKKFRWSGDVWIFTKKGQAERLCDVTLCDPTEPLPKSLRLSMVFNEDFASFKLEKLMGRVQLKNLILAACQKPTHIARMEPKDQQDVNVLRGLSRHMSQHDLATYALLELDNSPAALLVVIPSSTCQSWKNYISIPPDQRSSPFVVLLCPWTCFGRNVESSRLKHIDSVQQEVLDAITSGDNSPEAQYVPRRVQGKSLKPRYLQALKILRFPKHLHDFMSRPDHPFAIWHQPSDGSSQAGFETSLLRVILKECGAKELGLEHSLTRVLFVHVGSIHTLHTAPQIVERKQQLFLQIYTYGTHHSVSPLEWGVKEIYAFGGIVTFTPSAFEGSAGAIQKLIKMVDEHMFWLAFVTPSVMAFLLKRAHDDPLAAYDSGRFAHRELLELVENGQLSIIRAPPVRVPDDDGFNAWIEWHWNLSFCDTRDVLVQCLKTYDERYARSTGDALRLQLLEEVETTVRAVMQQPVMMREHRRYVVIAGRTDVPEKWTKGGMEWLSYDKFEFGDDYWLAEELKGLALCN